MFSFEKKIRIKYKKKIFKQRALIGDNISIGPFANCFSNKKNNVKIGNNCEINGVLYSYGSGKIIIGNNSFINTDTFIGAMESVCIGDCVIIATNVRIFDNNNHPTDVEARKNMSLSGFHNEKWEWKYAKHKPVKIGDNVWIGEYSAILKGVSIGEGSIIASHSVVVKDVPANCIVAGNPARVVKYLKKND